MAEITVTARVTFTYDTEDGLVDNEADAIQDMTEVLDSGSLSADDFYIEVK